MRAIFEQARLEGLILSNPAEHLTLPKSTQTDHSRCPITDEEEHLILEIAQTHRAGLWVKLMLYCGLRPGEDIVLCAQDIDLDAHRLTVHAALEAVTGNLKGPKSTAGVRTIPIPELLLPDLAAALPNNPDALLFTQPRTGKMHTRTSMRCMWTSSKRAMDIHAGADDLVPCCLRHTYCTRLQEAGVLINIARELMGHSSIELTSRIYTHSNELPIQQAEESLNALARKRQSEDVVT